MSVPPSFLPKRYAEPEFDPESSSSYAPTSAVSPDNATEKPNLSSDATSIATILFTWPQLSMPPSFLPKRYAEPEFDPPSSSR